MLCQAGIVQQSPVAKFYIYLRGGLFLGSCCSLSRVVEEGEARALNWRGPFLLAGAGDGLRMAEYSMTYHGRNARTSAADNRQETASNVQIGLELFDIR
jgi:hypothetical protein